MTPYIVGLAGAVFAYWVSDGMAEYAATGAAIGVAYIVGVARGMGSAGS